MKKAIIIFAWVSIIGSIGDGLIAIYCILLSVFQSSVEFNITVDQLLKDHIYFLYWAKQVAYLVMPHSFVNWLFWSSRTGVLSYSGGN